MYADFGDDVEFFMVYIKEAHPVDGRQSRANERDEIFIKQPVTLAERTQVAEKMCQVLKIELPPLIDSIDDQTSRDYSALPDRLYLVGADGHIVYKGPRGPRGFDADELREAIVELLHSDRDS